MEKRAKIIGLIVVALIVVLVGVSLNKTATGQATLTPGAVYGPIDQSFDMYVDCSYVDEDDGWDVTKKTTVTYRDRMSASSDMNEYSDECRGTDNVLVEFHCEDGYRKSRRVQCPTGTKCSDGACV